MVIIKPEDWENAKASLTPGSQFAPAYDATMDQDGFESCAAAN